MDYLKNSAHQYTNFYLSSMVIRLAQVLKRTIKTDSLSLSDYLPTLKMVCIILCNKGFFYFTKGNIY